MKLFMTTYQCRAFFALENPRSNRVELYLSEGTILLGAGMEEFEKRLDNRYAFVISPEGELLFLPWGSVKEV